MCGTIYAPRHIAYSQCAFGIGIGDWAIAITQRRLTHGPFVGHVSLITVRMSREALLALVRCGGLGFGRVF